MARNQSNLPPVEEHVREAPAKNTKGPDIDYASLEVPGVKVRRFNPVMENVNGEHVKSPAWRMLENLVSQPKVPCFIPLGWGEKEGAKQFAQMNDLAFWIRKNQMVQLPRQLVEHLLESLKYTNEALNPFVIDGDGKVVRAQAGAGTAELSK